MLFYTTLSQLESRNLIPIQNATIIISLVYVPIIHVFDPFAGRFAGRFVHLTVGFPSRSSSNFPPFSYPILPNFVCFGSQNNSLPPPPPIFSFAILFSPIPNGS